MIDKIELTKEILMDAATYMPLNDKEAWVSENAPKCFDKLAITADNEPLPPMYMLNTGLKSRYLMAILVGGYLNLEIKTEERDAGLMSVEDYDRWAGNHVLNQIERMKKDADVRDTCYDLLADFKDLEKRFSAQLNGLLTIQNDTVIRQSEYTATQMKEELPLILEQLKELQGKGEASG